MIDLPVINLQVITYLFGSLLSSLLVVWGINKAIIISKTH